MNNPLDPGYYCSKELRSFGFKAVGENVRISRNCVVIGPQNISLGDNIRIDSGTTIIATGGRLTLAGLNHIGGQCHFCVAVQHLGKCHAVFKTKMVRCNIFELRSPEEEAQPRHSRRANGSIAGPSPLPPP